MEAKRNNLGELRPDAATADCMKAMLGKIVATVECDPSTITVTMVDGQTFEFWPTNMEDVRITRVVW